MAEPEQSKRQVAHKVRVADILNNRYVKEDGWLPNYIAVGERKVSRANIIGVIVSKDLQEGNTSSQNFVLDDNTGRISLRFFEHGKGIEVGNIVLVIGRPREFGAERYVVPEVMKNVTDPKWVELRRLELAQQRHQEPAEDKSPKTEELSVETEDLAEESNPTSRLINIIKDLDDGSGAGFEDISVKFGSTDPEEHVKRLLEQGDIFEVKPGRYKVLE
ncbi:hypothetical protein ACFL3V_01960 [Nanoarchaeota archaeon]